MNTKRVQALVLRYKNGEKNKVIKDILKEYEAIIKARIQPHYNDINDYEELLDIANYQLTLALETYDPSKGCEFNTYAFYYLSAINRLFYKTKPEHKLDMLDIDTMECPPAQPTDLLDELNTDLHNILSREELLIYSTYLTKRISSNVEIDKIKKKIKRYLYD